MTPDFDAFLDDVFLGCAFAAFVDLATLHGGPPDSLAVKKLAYRYYEEELAKRSTGSDACTPPQSGLPSAT